MISSNYTFTHQCSNISIPIGLNKNNRRNVEIEIEILSNALSNVLGINKIRKDQFFKVWLKYLTIMEV